MGIFHVNWAGLEPMTIFLGIQWSPLTKIHGACPLLGSPLLRLFVASPTSNTRTYKSGTLCSLQSTINRRRRYTVQEIGTLCSLSYLAAGLELRPNDFGALCSQMLRQVYYKTRTEKKTFFPFRKTNKHWSFFAFNQKKTGAICS